MTRTDKEIVDQTHKLAVEFYRILGYHHKGGKPLYESQHPTELAMWRMACLAQEMLTDTDPEECLYELDEFD